MEKSALIAGMDEVGRGPLAGPVVAGVVILPVGHQIEGLADSKKLSEKRREALYDIIIDEALAWAVGRGEVEEIDRVNILQANFLAMQRAMNLLTVQPDLVQVDGNQCPKLNVPVEAVIKGDQKIPAIMAASIVAKVTRDREMREMDAIYPGYGFAQHKGYGTKAHMAAIERLGPCRIHRRSFAPISRL